MSKRFVPSYSLSLDGGEFRAAVKGQKNCDALHRFLTVVHKLRAGEVITPKDMRSVRSGWKPYIVQKLLLRKVRAK